ncbi:MAG: class I SAM-dependent methyltransferase, partial [Ignavibacteriaceae bacterium]|nr:class I SAM-dependent methyltransferase [Ignavibacteriaceae bacterium]
MNNCIVCGSNLIVKIHDHFPGYIKGKDYEVFSCKNCDSHFIDPQKIDNALYSIIYSNGNILGYDRYLKYASEILNQSDALKYLTSKESTYYPVFKFLRNKRNLKILELGCGYGYLTYAIRREGHDCFGIDLSQQAIDFALSN